MAEKILSITGDEPISLDATKLHLRVIDSEEDALIGALITSARQLAEHETGMALIEQTRQVTLDSMLPFAGVMLEKLPVVSIESISYRQSTGELVVLAVDDYRLLQPGTYESWVEPGIGKCWPAVGKFTDAFQLVYKAGLADVELVPKAMKQWMLLQIGHWYEHRESVNIGNITSRLPNVNSLLDPYKVWKL